MRVSVVSTAIWMSLIGLSAAAEVEAAIRRATHIPAQGLGPALQAFAKDHDFQVLYRTEVVGKLHTAGAVGELTTEEVLQRLLNGTGLTYRYLDEKTITIVAQARSGAKNHRSQLRNESGGTAAAFARVEQVSEDSLVRGPELETNAQPGREELEMVIVTGSRLKRIDIEGPSPVQVITRQDIDRSGAATVREILNTTTQNAVARDESGNGTFLGASTVQLRGLPIGTTLILLNGRRVGPSGPQVAYNIFDLSNVPLEAVERIEVLTDSASAVYGADAIGGAVNIILREGYEGAGGGLRYGTSAEGDADERQASFTIGRSSEALSGMVVLDYYDRDLLHMSDREVTSTNDFRRFGGEDLRSTWSSPGNVYSLDGSPLPGLTNSFAGIPGGTDGIGLTPADFQATDGVLNLFDAAPYQTVLAGAERKSVFASAQYRISADLKLFSEVLYTHRTQLLDFPPEPLPYGQLGFFVVPADNPFNPFGVDVGIDYRFMELGARTYDTTTDFARFVAGASGALGRFEWELYWLGDRDEAEVFNGATLNSLSNMAVIQQYLDSTDPNVALNVFSTTGNNNPQTLAAILGATLVTDDLSSRASMAEAVVRGPLWRLPAGDLSAVLGVNVRREKVAFLSPLVGDLRNQRDSKSLFMELALPLVGPAQDIPAISSLELTAAARHDDYEDFDSSTEPQVGITWRPMPSLLIRSSYGEAYKAPTPFQLFFPQLQFPGSVLDPARGGEPAEVALTFGGNRDLKPEQGTSITIGFVWQPVFARGWSLSMNAFRVRQDDFITSLDATTLLENEALFPARVVRTAPLPGDPPGTPGPIVSIDGSNLNFGRLTTKGFDAEVQHAFAPGAYGEFVATFYATYIDEFEILLVPSVPATNEVNRANQSGYPMRFRGNTSLTWSGFNGWSATLNARYRGSYTDFDGIHELPSQTLVDLQLGRRFGDRGDVWIFDNVETTLGVINLTDEQGSYARTFAGYDFLQSDLRGRFFYLNFKARF